MTDVHTKRSNSSRTTVGGGDEDLNSFYSRFDIHDFFSERMNETKRSCSNSL